MEQVLSKSFNKSQTEFRLDLEEVEKLTSVSKDSMKMLIIMTMKQLPDQRGSTRAIKAKMQELYPDKLIFD